MKRTIVNTLALILSLTFVADAHAQKARPKIGLALSGGGAKGCAHVGVLRQLELMHVPVDYVAGTSMGSVVGALYASGMTPDEMEKALVTIDWDEALSDATAFYDLTYRRKFEEVRYPSTVEVGVKKGKIVTSAGIRTGQKLSFLLARFLLPVLDQNDFTKLPIPYAAVASDLETGEPYVLTKGDLAQAVRASMSIPGAFIPVEIDGKILVDGGVTRNVPVDIVRQMGADIVIAVDIASPLGKRESFGSTRGVVGQLSSFLTRKNMEPQLAAADVVISPPIAGYDVFAFGKAAEIVKLGDNEAIKNRDKLVRYAIDPAEHKAMLEKRHVPRDREIRIDEIKVVGTQFVQEQFIHDQMETKAGDVLDMEKLQKDVEWLYGWNDFVGISAGLDTAGGKNTLIMRVNEKPWGPAYLRTGIGVETRYNNPGVFLLLNYTRRWINERGAEWRNDVEFGNDWGLETEFYQPRGYDKIGFFAPGASYHKGSVRVFNDGAAVGQYETRQFTVRLDGGVQLRNAGEARIGLFQRWNDASTEVGLPSYPTVHDSEGGFSAQLHVNTTDKPFFPDTGARLDYGLVAPLKSLGADHQYVSNAIAGKYFSGWGRHQFSVGAKFHEVFGGTAPVYDQAIFGGLGNLSGYAYGELLNQAGALFSLGYRNRVTRIPGLSEGVYAGVSLEAGDVYNSLSDLEIGDLRSSGTFFMGVDTTYGPLVLAVGKTRNKDAQYYIQIGRSF